MPKLSADQIRTIRSATGDSQPAFAKRIGCTWVQVSRWENGHQAPSNAYTAKLRRVARAQGVDV